MSAWDLPQAVELGGEKYKINTDFRDILEIIGYLNDRRNPEYIRWEIALALFYAEVVPHELTQDAMFAMAQFIGEDQEEESRPQLKLIDWEQDAKIIVSDINKVAGMEVRSLPYLHWWTFLAYFRGIGEGQLSAVVSIRSKLAKHQKLEKWEQEYYRDNKKAVDFKVQYTAEELEEQAKLNEILNS